LPFRAMPGHEGNVEWGEYYSGVVSWTRRGAGVDVLGGSGGARMGLGLEAQAVRSAAVRERIAVVRR